MPINQKDVSLDRKDRASKHWNDESDRLRALRCPVTATSSRWSLHKDRQSKTIYSSYATPTYWLQPKPPYYHEYNFCLILNHEKHITLIWLFRGYGPADNWDTEHEVVCILIFQIQDCAYCNVWKKTSASIALLQGSLLLKLALRSLKNENLSLVQRSIQRPQEVSLLINQRLTMRPFND